MCVICVDYSKGNLSIKEAIKNLSEVFDEEDKHHTEVWFQLLEDECNLEINYEKNKR